MSYATTTIEKVYSMELKKETPKVDPIKEVTKGKIRSIGELLAQGDVPEVGSLVNGPNYLDSGVLVNNWRTSQLLGLIGGSGIGKTAYCLNLMKTSMENDPDQEFLHVFVSIEMPTSEIVKRWLKMNAGDKSYVDRLYVLDSQDEQNENRMIGLQEIHFFVKKLEAQTGKKVGILAIDHFHILSPHINSEVLPNFGAAAQTFNRSKVKQLTPNDLASQLKTLAKSLDTFTIILSQTSKSKGVGDLPIGKDGSYNNSQYEWICDRIVTIWQPLMRVQHLLKERYLAFQYVKNRHKHEDDRLQEYDKKVLRYEPATGDLTPASKLDYQIFSEMLPKAEEIRKSLDKNEAESYTLIDGDF